MQKVAVDHIGFAGSGREFDAGACVKHLTPRGFIGLGNVGLGPIGARMLGQCGRQSTLHDVVASIPENHRTRGGAGLVQGQTKNELMIFVADPRTGVSVQAQPIYMRCITFQTISKCDLSLSIAGLGVAGFDDRDLRGVEIGQISEEGAEVL